MLYSVKIFAFPVEGSYARYEAKLDGINYEYKKAILFHNKDDDTFVNIATVLKEGEIIIETSATLPRSWFYTENKVEDTLKNCNRRYGALGFEMIEGKKIQTCTFHHEESQLDYSIGNVPFGQVRFPFYLGDSKFLDFYLVNFN